METASRMLAKKRIAEAGKEKYFIFINSFYFISSPAQTNLDSFETPKNHIKPNEKSSDEEEFYQLSPEKKKHQKLSLEDSSLSEQENAISPSKLEALKLPLEDDGDSEGPEDEVDMSKGESVDQ